MHVGLKDIRHEVLVAKLLLPGLKRCQLQLVQTGDLVRCVKKVMLAVCCSAYVHCVTS